ncbi:transporter substrate-binding domain-containing protein [Clostridium sp. P21]|uniref:Transporter substrate-binding domain-containing protein n=1 Tax=Clostridium muellerianum TaxID=2716538 RepID=A0A7Y0ED91_9CLOT|nr:transporter substrate-binding domain-containing protein [Clostridium muellerianum]NMM61354.1 transporter substrate-binding domain-containing protein [Clostridium muellerianum]
MLKVICIFTLILLISNIVLAYKVYGASKNNKLETSNIIEKNNSDTSVQEIDDFIILFLKLINDIIKYSEYLSLSMKDISGQSTILTDNSQLHIIDLEKTKNQLEDMHDKLSNNLKISEEIKDTFEVVNSSIKERQQRIIKGINEYKVVQENMKVSKKSIDDLVNYTMKVQGTINNISEISKQISMLALNASIEASRAGEYGKGFSVVADEVKKLSNETDEATNDIFKVLRNINQSALTTQSDVTKTINILDSQSTMLQETVNSIDEIVQMVVKTLSNVETLTNKNIQSNDTCTNVNSTASVVLESVGNDMTTIKQIDDSLKNENKCVEELVSSTSDFKYLSKNLFKLLEKDENTLVAVTEEYPPFVIENKDINNQGIDIDIIREICNRNNINFKMFFAPFDLSLELVKDGAVHMIPTLSYTEDRNKIINFTNPYRDESKFILITNKNNKKAFNCYDDMKECKIGIISMYTYPSNFLNDRNIIKDENYKLDTLFYKLLKNQIDVVLLNDYIGKYYINSNNLQDKVCVSDYILKANENFDARLGLSKKKNTEKLTQIFNEGFKELAREGIIDKIESKYIKFDCNK